MYTWIKYTCIDEYTLKKLYLNYRKVCIDSMCPERNLNSNGISDMGNTQKWEFLVMSH